MPTRPHLVTGRPKTVPPPGLQGYGYGSSTQRKTPAEAEARSSIGSETNSTNAFTGQASPTENTCHGTACVRVIPEHWPKRESRNSAPLPPRRHCHDRSLDLSLWVAALVRT